MNHTALTTYRAILAAAAAPAEPGRVRIPTSDRGCMLLQRDPVTLQRWADLVLKNWTLYGGGPKPAEIAKPARKLGAAWSAPAVQVWREQIELGQHTDAARLALEKLGARFYLHRTGSPFCLVAPKPVQGLPAYLVSGRRDDGKWIVFDIVSGQGVGVQGELTRASAEKWAARQWTMRSADQQATALRIARRDHNGTQAAALAAWCELHQIDPADIPAALPDVAAADVDPAPAQDAQQVQPEPGADVVQPVAETEPAAPVAAAVDPAPVAYSLPANTYAEWAGSAARGFVASPRQLLVLAAVRQALAEGLFYSSQVVARCAEILHPGPEILAAGANKVEGGEFGMDCYYARRVIDAQELHAREDLAAEKLKAGPGQVLGALMFNDFKLTRACRVTSIDQHGELTIEGTRGRALARFRGVKPLQVLAAMERAQERGHRRADAKPPAAPTPTPAGRQLRQTVSQQEPAPAPAPAAPAPAAPVAAHPRLPDALQVLAAAVRPAGQDPARAPAAPAAPDPAPRPALAALAAELDQITQAARDRMRTGGAELDAMTPAERARRHAVVQQLPKFAQDQAAARARVAARVALRRAAAAARLHAGGQVLDAARLAAGPVLAGPDPAARPGLVRPAAAGGPAGADPGGMRPSTYPRCSDIGAAAVAARPGPGQPARPGSAPVWGARPPAGAFAGVPRVLAGIPCGDIGNGGSSWRFRPGQVGGAGWPPEPAAAVGFSFARALRPAVRPGPGCWPAAMLHHPGAPGGQPARILRRSAHAWPPPVATSAHHLVADGLAAARIRAFQPHTGPPRVATSAQ